MIQADDLCKTLESQISLISFNLQYVKEESIIKPTVLVIPIIHLLAIVELDLVDTQIVQESSI